MSYQNKEGHCRMDINKTMDNVVNNVKCVTHNNGLNTHRYDADTT